MLGENVRLKISKTPVGLTTARFHPQTLVIGLFALNAMSQGLVDVADRKTQPDLRRIKARRLFKSRQRILLTQQARVHRSQCNPVLWVFGFHLQQIADGHFRLGQPAGRKQCMTEAAPRKRQVGRLLQGMAQQALGIMSIASSKRQRSKPAQRRDMTCVALQDVAEDGFGRLTVARNERCGRLLDTLQVRIEEARLLECELRIRELLELDKHVGVGKPGGVECGRLLQNALQLLTCGIQSSALAIGTCKIRTRMCEGRCSGDRSFECLDGRLRLALREQRDPQEAQTIYVTWGGCLDRTQLPLSALGSPATQCRQSLAVGGAQSRL